MVGAKRRDIGLGGYPAVTLAMAHELARDLRNKVRNEGIDPIAERRNKREMVMRAQAREVTFKACALEFIDLKEAEWKSAKHAKQWAATLETYAYPKLGSKIVQNITKEDVLAVIEPIWRTKTETASRVRGRIESILSWAIAKGYYEGLNPARLQDNIKGLLPKRTAVAKVVHHRALNRNAVSGFISAVRQKKGIGSLALEFLILTAARSGEVRGALK